MSFYDDASLVVIPSAQKTSKLYAVKPTDGSGDLAFTRTGDTATRVNSAGLIEKVRTNLVLQSETFDNASGTKSLDGQVTITAIAAVAPNGTTTAEKRIARALAGFHCVQQQVTLSAGEASVSVYAKAAENSFLQIFDALTTEFVNFNLTTGVVGSSSVYVGSVEDAGNGWYRCKATKVVPSGTFSARIGVVTSATAARGESFTGNGTNGLLIWGAQLEYGVATPYIPTLTAAVSTGPTANVPRLDYLGSTCPRLLLEPQRTNLLQFSEQIDNAYWTKQDTSITANTFVSPDGYTNADSLIENSATAQHLAMRTGITITNATAYTASVYFKANTRTRAAIQLAGAGFFDTANGLVIFNLSTGTIVSQSGNATGTITAMGNGWYRCTATKTSVGTSGVVAFNLVDSSNNISYAGNGTSGVFLWGAQLETNFATSYIPTLAASATRGADACSKTGISSLIGQTEGTVFVDWQIDSIPSVGSYFTFFLYQSSGNSMYVGVFPDGRVQAVVYVGSVLQCNLISSFGFITAGANKFAFGYKANDFVLYANGVQVATDTSGSVPASTSIDLADTSGGKMNYKQALLFKTRLTNAQLAELTTL